MHKILHKFEMASRSQEEEEFQQIIREIGGKERIYLVCDACKAEDGNRVDILEQFIKDIFSFCVENRGDINNFNQAATKSSNGVVTNASKDQEIQSCRENTATSNNATSITATHSGQELCPSPRPHDLNGAAGEETRTTRLPCDKVHKTKNTGTVKRTIDSPVIIFIFRQEFIKCRGNRRCLKEILKDVKARTKGAAVLPAVLGLVYSGGQSEAESKSMGVLELLLRSVFIHHSPESIWVGPFIPRTNDVIQTIKKNVCKTLQASFRDGSRAAQPTPLSQVSQWFLWIRRGRQTSGTNRTLCNSHQGGTESGDESVPLKKTQRDDGRLTDCSTMRQDSHTTYSV